MLYVVASEYFGRFLRDAATSIARWQHKHPTALSREFLTLNYKVYG